MRANVRLDNGQNRGQHVGQFENNCALPQEKYFYFYGLIGNSQLPCHVVRQTSPGTAHLRIYLGGECSYKHAVGIPRQN